MMALVATMKLTAVFKKVPDGYATSAEGLPGANTRAETLEEARENLAEAVSLVREVSRRTAEESLERAEVMREKLVLPPA